MHFEIRDVSEDDFKELMDVYFYTYENPLQGPFRIWSPLNPVGAPTPDHAGAVKESTERFWDWHVTDPTSHWIRVVDTDDNDKVIGACLWKIYDKNPYEEPPSHPEVYWHPEGGQREYATQILYEHEAVREKLAQRPHIYYQRKGAGRLILQWGVKKAEEMGVELWLDAWHLGKPMYEKMGFTIIEHHVLKPETDNPDEAWKRCEKEWGPLEEWIMWRPKDGPYVEGKSVKPWETA